MENFLTRSYQKMMVLTLSFVLETEDDSKNLVSFFLNVNVTNFYLISTKNQQFSQKLKFSCKIQAKTFLCLIAYIRMEFHLFSRSC